MLESLCNEGKLNEHQKRKEKLLSVLLPKFCDVQTRLVKWTKSEERDEKDFDYVFYFASESLRCQVCGAFKASTTLGSSQKKVKKKI